MSDGAGVVIANEAGTNVAEVKGASTAAVAADKALVVAVSPNNTVAVSAASLPLPSGAATAANQTTLGNQTTKINDGTNTATVTGANALKVDGSAVTQPVSDGGGSLTIDGSVAVSNFPAVQPVSDNGGSLTVDTPQLPAALVGGRLDVVVGAPLPAGTNNIGDVDVLSVPAPLSTAGGGTEATALRVTIANDSTGLVSVDDNGGSLTVDGPLTDAELRASAVPVSVASLPLPTGAATAANQTTLGSQTTKINDGTNTAAVKAASTPAVAADPALVVAVSPNNTIAVSMAGGGYGGQVEGLAADGATPSGNPVLIGGMDGTNVQTLLTDTQGRLVIAPSGASTSEKGFSQGRVVLASTAVAAVRETTYTEQTSNAQRSIVSANAADAAAGTGARSVRITYYSVSGSTVTGPFTETVTLNGTTAVDTVSTTIAYIEKLEVLTVGSGLVNAGIISLKAATAGGGATVWSIAAGANSTFGAHHYVPSSVSCFITGFLVGIKGADTTGGIIRAVNPTSANNAEIQVSDNVRAPSSGQNFRSYGTPIVVPGPARIVAYAVPDSTSSRTYYASFDFYEE